MPAPAAPDSVTATPGDLPTTIDIGWTAPAGGAWPDGTTFEITAAEKVRGTRVRYTATATPKQLSNLSPGSYTFEVRAVAGGLKSDPTTSAEAVVPDTEVSSLWRTTSYSFCALWAIAAVVFLLVMAVDSKRDHIFGSLALAAGVMFIGLIALAFAGGKYGLWRSILGDDRRFSTSRTQIALWTVLIAFVLVFFAGRTWFGHEQHLYDGFPTSANTTTTTLAPTTSAAPTTTVAPTPTSAQSTSPPTTTAVSNATPSGSGSSTTIWDDYLLLLGGPFAALVLAKGIVSSQITNGTIQKTVADDGTANILQLVQDDGGNPDLVDSQYFLFNLVAFAYVVVGLANTDRLPTIPPILLALTGSSAATYVLNKAISGSAPAVSAIVPSSAHPGDRVVLQGANLAPAGTSVPPTVTVAGINATVEANPTDTAIAFIVPPGVATGAQPVVVTTGARATTSPQTMQVLADKPLITSITPVAAVAPTDLTIDGWFLTDLDTENEVGVSLGGASRPAQVIRVSPTLQRVVVNSGVVAVRDIEVIVTTQRGTKSDPFAYSFRH